MDLLVRSEVSDVGRRGKERTVQRIRLPFANDDRQTAPLKDPLSSELIACDIDSWLSIHSSNPTIGQDEIIEFRNH